VTFAWELGCRGLIEGPATFVLEKEGIDGGWERGGGGVGGLEWIGAGEDGAENRDDGEPGILASSLRIGVAGYATFNEVDNTMAGRMADRSDSSSRARSLSKFPWWFT
jgi:hypothetical protein